MQNFKTKILTESSIALALAVILSQIRLFQMPQGGSVSLEMLPVIFIALRWGVKSGILLGSAFGILQFFISGYIVHWAQLILDYPLAFGVLGLAGVARFFIKENNLGEKMTYVIVFTIFAGSLRFLAHFISGVVFFAEYAGEEGVVLYSLIYNATYLVPEIIITVVAMFLLIKGLDNTLLLETKSEA